jgi:hypothetical protein
MAVIVRIGDLSVVPLQASKPRGVAVRNTELLNALVLHPQDTLQFVRDQLGFPVYLAEVEIEDDGTMVLRSEHASARLVQAHAAKASPQAKPASNCICGRGC